MNVPPIAPMSAWSGFLAGAALSIFAAVPWLIIFLLTPCVGLRLYVLTEREACGRIQRRVWRATHTGADGKSSGYFVGRWYIGHITVTPGECGDQYSAWFVATAGAYETLTRTEATTSVCSDGDGDGEVKETRTITVADRRGSYYNPWFGKRQIPVSGLKPRANQEGIVQSILDHQARYRHTVAFLTGPPGTGKSMIGILVAAGLGGIYCNTVCPWQPGDSLNSVYSEMEPTAEKPLVLVFDEVDGALVAIHAGAVPSHKSMPIAVANKAGWNRMLDEIGRGMFPHLVLLMTSNRDAAFVRSLDPSYIREGRVDIVATVE